MRMLMKVVLNTEKANASVAEGTLAKTMQAILAELKPEAAYFAAVDGRRAGYLFVNLQDASQIPSIAEPWFLAFDASIELQPVMIVDDLAKAGPALEAAGKKYGGKTS
jgi:hypothetical protein